MLVCNHMRNIIEIYLQSGTERLRTSDNQLKSLPKKSEKLLLESDPVPKVFYGTRRREYDIRNIVISYAYELQTPVQVSESVVHTSNI